MLDTARARQNAFIGTFLLLQLAIPLHYYLTERGDDERFSWRMFSTVRLQRCRIDIEAVAAGGREEPVAPQEDIQVAWINLLKRGRPPVIKRYLARVCQQRQADQVHFRRRCLDTDGSSLPAQHLIRNCQSGALTRAELKP